MNFASAGRADHSNDLAAGRPAHDGIIHENHPVSVDDAANRVELHLDAEMPNRLLRLNEGSPYVVIPDESHSHGNSGCIGKPHCGAHAGVGNRDDNVCLGGAFVRQTATQLCPYLVYALAEDIAVRAREIHVLEDALCLRRRGEWLNRPHAGRAQNDELARLDVSDVLRPDQIQCAGL